MNNFNVKIKGLCALLMITIMIPQIAIADDTDNQVCVTNNSSADKLSVQFVREDNQNTAYLYVEPGQTDCTKYPVSTTPSPVVYCTNNGYENYKIQSLPANLTCSTTLSDGHCKANCSVSSQKN